MTRRNVVRLCATWLCALSLAFACSSEPDDPITSPAPRGGSGGTSGTSGTGGTGNAGSGNDGGEGGDSCAEVMPMAEVCPRDMVFGAPTTLPIAGDGSDLFGSITPDELHIAWMTGGEADGIVHYADRSSAGDPFEATRDLDAVEGFYALERVALSPDGLTLIAVRSDKLAFGAFTRESADEPFVFQPDLYPFSTINNDSEIPIGDPLFSADGTSLYYFSEDAMMGGVFRVLSLEDGSDVIFTDPALVSEPGVRKRLSGISSDSLTLFFWHMEAGGEQAAYRPIDNCPFDTVVELGDRFLAAPNEDCTRLYFSSADGLATADRE